MRKFLLSGLFTFLITTCLAQKKTLSVNKNHPSTITTSSSSSTYERTVFNEIEKKDEIIYLDITETKNRYILKSTFPLKYESKIKKIIVEEFGNKNIQIKDNKLTCNLVNSDFKIYNIVLQSNQLTVDLNKELSSKNLVNKFTDFGLNVKNILSD